MPWICDCSPTKGKTEPASALLSPVARDYPNRALRRFFHAGGASTVPSKNRGKTWPGSRQSHGFVFHNLFTCEGL